MRVFFPCALALLLLVPATAAAQKAKAQPQKAATSTPAPQEGFTRCVEDWKVGPPAIHGNQDHRFRLEIELPDACREKPVFYEVVGRDKVQRATCDFSIIYGSGGASEKVRVEVAGTEAKAGEIPSYLKEAVRRVRVRCFALDEYKPFDARLCVTCGQDTKKGDLFDQELEKFLKQ